MALNDTTIRNLKPGNRREILVADVGGLYMRARGGKGRVTRTWQWRRKEALVVRVVTLGTYPALSLKEARLKAAELSTKRSAYSPTVEEAATQWLRERVDPNHRRAEHVRGYVDRAVVPGLGDRRVRDVEPADVATVVRAYRDRVAKLKRARTGGRPAARALLVTMKGLFSYCVANGWISTSPAAQITDAAIGGSEKARDRTLTDDEIKTVMTTEAAPGPLLRFLLATGLRIGEAYDGHRAGQHWVVPADVAKNGKPHDVWLSPVALAALDQRPWIERRTAQHWITVNAGGWVAHDLRRTFATRLNGMGVAPHVVERCLNHTLPGIMAVYNRATYDTERKEALERWSNWLLEKLVEVSPVVPLRSVA